jgi:hypothetical protein
LPAGRTLNPWDPLFATHIVDVEVDPETGQVRLLRYTAVQDAGKAVHPAYLCGQIQGAVTQGIGWALNEEYIYDAGGHLLNDSYLDYRIPTCLDVPNIEPIIVKCPPPAIPLAWRWEMSIVLQAPSPTPSAAWACACPYCPCRRKDMEALWEKVATD